MCEQSFLLTEPALSFWQERESIHRGISILRTWKCVEYHSLLPQKVVSPVRSVPEAKITLPPPKKLLLKILKRNILKTSVLFHLFCLKLGNRIRLGRARASLLLTLIYYPFACPGQSIFLILAILDKKFKLYAYIHT